MLRFVWGLRGFWFLVGGLWCLGIRQNLGGLVVLELSLPRGGFSYDSAFGGLFLVSACSGCVWVFWDFGFWYFGWFMWNLGFRSELCGVWVWYKAEFQWDLGFLADFSCLGVDFPTILGFGGLLLVSGWSGTTLVFWVFWEFVFWGDLC